MWISRQRRWEELTKWWCICVCGYVCCAGCHSVFLCPAGNAQHFLTHCVILNHIAIAAQHQSGPGAYGNVLFLWYEVAHGYLVEATRIKRRSFRVECM